VNTRDWQRCQWGREEWVRWNTNGYEQCKLLSCMEIKHWIQIWQRTCDTYNSVSCLFHLIGWLPFHPFCCKLQDFIFLYCSILCVFVSCFIYPLIGWSHILAVLSSVTIRLGMHVSLLYAYFISFVYIYPVVTYLSLMVVPFLGFWGTSILFSIVTINLHPHWKCIRILFSL
jgi:hypothetical protein